MVMMMGVQTHVLSNKASLSKIRALIRAELIRAGVRPSAAFDCLVGVTEASTIALVNHGKVDSDTPRPRIGWIIDYESARFLLEDYSGTDWNDLDESDEFRAHNRSLQELGIDNPGMTALRGLMDSVEIDLDGGLTRVTFVKRLHREAGT